MSPRSQSSKPPRLYFSFRSPYSRMAIAKLQRAVPDMFDRFDVIPYWDPDERTEAALAAAGGELPYVQMSRAKHFYILGDTKRLAEQLGLTMVWPIDKDPWWEPVHLGWLVARDLGRGAQFYAAAIAARWERGEDLDDPLVLQGVARAAGVNPDLITAACDDPATRSKGVECLWNAYNDDVFGVPYIKYGRHRFWGLDRIDMFLHMWSEQGSSQDETTQLDIANIEDLAPYDSDTAGGCG